MDWTLYFVFAVSGLLMTGAQRWYFRELSNRGVLKSDDQVAEEILGRPRTLALIVRTETVDRLVSLLTRQRDTRPERLRMLALLSVVLTLGSFVWMMMTAGGER